MNQQPGKNSSAIQKRLIDGMVDYMNIEGIAENHDAFYGQEHIDQCQRRLEEFVESVKEAGGNQDQVMACVESTVIALNQLNEGCGRSMFETDQREDLCAFIEEVIVENGIDIDALAATRNLTRHQITDEWRDR